MRANGHYSEGDLQRVDKVSAYGFGQRTNMAWQMFSVVLSFYFEVEIANLHTNTYQK